MIREALASVARNESISGVLARTPVARDLVTRVVGGETIDDVLPVIADLADRGFFVALEHVEPDVMTRTEADEAAAAYRTVIDALADSGLADVAEVSVFTESLGQGVAGADEGAFGRLSSVVTRAGSRAVPIRLGVGPLPHVSQTLEWARVLIDRGDDVGVTLPAILRRTEQECAAWSGESVRLVKGAHADGAAAYRQPIETDKSFVRSAKELLRGTGHASFATHDPRLVAIVESLAVRFDRAPHSFEYAFYLGRQTGEQERLLAAGQRVRIYVPFGPRWLERLVGGLAEQPSGIGGALRSLLPG